MEESQNLHFAEIKKDVFAILLRYLELEDANDALDKLMCLLEKTRGRNPSDQQIDFAYFLGVFNVKGVDGLYDEIHRLKSLNKMPHEILKVVI